MISVCLIWFTIYNKISIINFDGGQIGYIDPTSVFDRFDWRSNIDIDFVTNRNRLNRLFPVNTI